ncbi:hypothetical protein M422DRAFT_270533 [Sphaerobolus stellatus SS14]|uniref:Major facilitator superfamily (MFS) profile domain-containing protein n=1 Tax=Sphaerobolus stellatus (strain SS14) TaxID=990650 RepID=A0A0C9TFP9_SPHS4|nr:hypothetical protein M422DRAFT_270533 [Sphaerobolus stellatus SS14]
MYVSPCCGECYCGGGAEYNRMITTRTIQGIGGGGILNLGEIIRADLISLAERRVYQGLLGLTWSFAAGIGPPIGSALAQKASWRRLFSKSESFSYARLRQS